MEAIVPDDLHLCTLSPGGFIETQDGARIRFDGRGYGLCSPERYLVSAALTFQTEVASYEWLTKVLAVMHGEFDEMTGRATWRVFVPKTALPSPSACWYARLSVKNDDLVVARRLAKLSMTARPSKRQIIPWGVGAASECIDRSGNRRRTRLVRA